MFTCRKDLFPHLNLVNYISVYLSDGAEITCSLRHVAVSTANDYFRYNSSLIKFFKLNSISFLNFFSRNEYYVWRHGYSRCWVTFSAYVACRFETVGRRQLIMLTGLCRTLMFLQTRAAKLSPVISMVFLNVNFYSCCILKTRPCTQKCFPGF